MRMRPMKLGGDALVFGEDALDYLATLEGQRAFLVTSKGFTRREEYLKRITGYLEHAGLAWSLFSDVPPDPDFACVLAGRDEMLAFAPDWIIAVGGGSVMDAAKAMWIYYEHPELERLEQILPPNRVPKLRQKAHMVCIPTTSGTGSEVSRSVVISDPVTHRKHGVGDMEMMPDVVLLEPGITASMSPALTAETGMDALTHVLEAYVSRRANELSDLLAEKAVCEIMNYLPLAWREGQNLIYREKMLVYSCVAGLCFTNVSLGIVHSLAHAVGGRFGVSHGLADAVLLPYVLDFNAQEPEAAAKYGRLATLTGRGSLTESVWALGRELGLPTRLKDVIRDDALFEAEADDLAQEALGDGCTKTNPIIPEKDEMAALLRLAYYGRGE